MKKYMLKKWYPSLKKTIKIGSVVSKIYNCGGYNYRGSDSEGNVYYVGGGEVENNPDFWELIEEEKPKPLFITDDGVELFSDIVTLYAVDLNNQGIESPEWDFKECEKMGLKIFYYKKNADKYIEENKPKPLFVTEDDIEIFDDTTEIISVSIKHHTVSKWGYRYLCKPLDCENFKHFGIEANADKYIEENKPKPIFITEDGGEVFDQEDVYYVTDKLEKINSFINWFTIENMAKDTKIFKHESNADEYIWRNKPVFSYEDFVRWGNVPYERVIEQLAKERIEK